MFPFFELFGKTIGSYALCAFAGFFAALCTAAKLAKPLKMDFADIILVFTAISGGMLAGGHLLYAATNIDSIVEYIDFTIEKIKNGTLTAEYIKLAFSECFGGSVFYGGFIGASAALVIYSKHVKGGLRKEFIDIFAVCVPLFHCFGRIGCFLGGCCYGIKSSIGFIAHNPLLPEISGVRRFPTALAESAFNLLLFGVLLYLYKSRRNCGRLIYVYMLIYPAGRFILEFFRGDEIRGIFFYLSTSQWISLALIPAAVIMLKLKAPEKVKETGKLNQSAPKKDCKFLF